MEVSKNQIEAIQLFVLPGKIKADADTSLQIWKKRQKGK